jgi:hypothetical protein
MSRESEAWGARAEPDADLIPDGRVDPSEEFDSAICQGLDLLQREIDFGLWSCTRAVGDDWFIQHSAKGNTEGSSREFLPWHESIGARMMALNGPEFAPDVSTVPAYVDAPVRRDFDIGAYVGVSLRRRDQSVFGSLYAVDRRARPALSDEQQAMVMYVARMIASLVDREHEIAGHYRAIELEALADARDAATGLLTEAGWSEALAIEERARRVLAATATVAYLRLLSEGGAGVPGAALSEVSADLCAKLPASAVVAMTDDRSGLLLLLPECDGVTGRQHLERLHARLTDRGFAAVEGIESARFDRPLVEADSAARNATFYR